MNKNEEYQFNILSNFIEAEKNYKSDIFYEANRVEQTNIEGYDAIVSFDGYKKYVQITTMSNLVSSKNGRTQHANGSKWTIKSNFNNDDEMKKNIKSLKKLGVERNIINSNKKSTHVRDTYKNILNNEKDLDIKYNINSAKLINATYRALAKKINKYNLKIKKEKSVLIIIDESENVFLSDTIVDFKNFTKKEKENYGKWTRQNYFNYILQAAIVESKFDETNFFDEVQVYFKQTATNVTRKEYYISNNNISSSVNLLEHSMSKLPIQPCSINNSFEFYLAIDKDDLKTSINDK